MEIGIFSSGTEECISSASFNQTELFLKQEAGNSGNLS